MRKALERKAPTLTLEDLGYELRREIPEAGADFADRVSEKLKKSGHDPTDRETRKAIIQGYIEAGR